MLLYPRTDRQARLIEMVAGFRAVFAERAEEYDRTAGFPFENVADLISAGYQTLTVPESLGGQGANLLEVALVQNELAKADGSTALCLNQHLSTLAIAGETRSWPAAMYDEVCREAATAGALINSAASEPELGSPASGGRPATLARRVEGGWLINGRKTFVTGAPGLTFLIVLATLEDGADPPMVANFLVRNGSPGVRIEEAWDTMGMRATASHDVVLDDVFVADGSLMNQRALSGAAETRGGAAGVWGPVLICAVYLGVAEAARDFAVEFATSRTPTALGRPISELLAVQLRAADMEIALTTGKALMLDAAAEYVDLPERRAELPLKVAAVKTAAIESAIRTVEIAMRITGGVSNYRRYPLERYYRDVRAGLAHPPLEDRAREQIGRAVLGAGRG